MLTKALIVFICLCFGACFEVPEEWREEIQRICKAAENSVYPHPSTDMQCLYGGTHDVGVQVKPILGVWMLTKIICDISASRL